MGPNAKTSLHDVIDYLEGVGTMDLGGIDARIKTAERQLELLRDIREMIASKCERDRLRAEAARDTVPTAERIPLGTVTPTAIATLLARPEPLKAVAVRQP